MIQGNQAYTYHHSATGHTLAMTDNNETIVNQYAYSPYGRLLGETETSGLEQPFKYVGKYGVQHEGDELYYMRARYYDADTGRFTMEDPIGIEGGLNVSLYISASPVKYVDPSGLAKQDCSRPISAIPGGGGPGAGFVGSIPGIGKGLGPKHPSKIGMHSQRAAHRQARRAANIPTSQQPATQTNYSINGNKVGRQQTYITPAAGGGTQTVSVQVSRDIRGRHAGMSQIESGVVKAGRFDSAGRPRIGGVKTRVDF